MCRSANDEKRVLTTDMKKTRLSSSYIAAVSLPGTVGPMYVQASAQQPALRTICIVESEVQPRLLRSSLNSIFRHNGNVRVSSEPANVDRPGRPWNPFVNAPVMFLRHSQVLVQIQISPYRRLAHVMCSSAHTLALGPLVDAANPPTPRTDTRAVPRRQKPSTRLSCQ